MSSSIRDQVFISYSHKDDKHWLKDLQTHLKPHLRGRSITAWSDEQIQPGSQWFDEIKNALAKTKVAVLLVTPDFLASDFIHEHELAPLLKDAEAGGVAILWIPVRTCAYKVSVLRNYQAVIDPEQPLFEMEAGRDGAWVHICEAISQAISPDVAPAQEAIAEDVTGQEKPTVGVLQPEAQPLFLRLQREMESATSDGRLRHPPIVRGILEVLGAEPRPILQNAFGLIHTWWMLNPLRSAAVAELGFLFVVGFSVLLGIGFRFHVEDEAINGFLLSHWSPLFLLAMPIAASLMALYFRAIDNALQSLDKIVRPVRPAFQPFSSCISERFHYAWAAWIFPVSLGCAVVFTLVADGRDILAPLQSSVISPSHERDWSTLGFKSANAWHAWWYFAFNVSAFTLQVFVGYCGILLLILTSYLMGFSIRYGLAGKELKSLFGSSDIAEAIQYKVKWEFSAPKGRCGLHMLDNVYFLNVALNFVCLAVSIVSVVVNEKSKGGADLGSAILMCGTVLFIPVSFVWILLPYYSNFPSELPPEFSNKGYPKPTPWPWGSETFTWGFIGVGVIAWACIAFEAFTFLVR